MLISKSTWAHKNYNGSTDNAYYCLSIIIYCAKCLREGITRHLKHLLCRNTSHFLFCWQRCCLVLCCSTRWYNEQNYPNKNKENEQGKISLPLNTFRFSINLGPIRPSRMLSNPEEKHKSLII